MAHKISVTLYGMSADEFKNIEHKFNGSCFHRADGRVDVTINLLETNDEIFIEKIYKSAFVGVV